MLVLNSLFVTSCRAFGLAAVVVSSVFVGAANGQQTPAQRYEPVRSNVYDTKEAQSDYYPEQVHREGVRQVAYQQGAEPAVPAILSGAKAPVRSNALGFPAPNSTSSVGGTVETMPRKSPADFANQMGVRRNSFSPVQSSRQVNQPEVKADKVVKSATIPVGVIPQSNTLPTPQSMSAKPAPPSTPVVQASAIRQVVTEAAAGRVQVQTQSIRSSVGDNSLSNDLRGPNTRVARQIRPAVGEVQAPKKVAKAVVQPAAEPQVPVRREAIRDQQVIPTAGSVPVSEKATIKIAAPAIEVVTVGPETIGINEASEYKVVVRNNSSMRAERILVGVNIPAWVDIESLSLTSGGKEITDGEGQARLVWSVDQVPGNSSQTMTISAVPRKAEIFDVGVEWTLVPLVGKTSIRVTEPKLEMSISGPKEVQYGETALYHVAVRNPGSGAAENVSVMLPEALGGERATLGFIPPGKEKHFQVELLARAAGDLNLVATAAAEGNLKVEAEQALIVRRAALAISMTGPALKYAGGVAKYSVTLTNTGDATATELDAGVALPSGVKYLKGIDAASLFDRGVRWPIGSLAPGESRNYEFFCQMETSGDLKLEVGARGRNDLAASSQFETTVETVADLVLSVADLKGPLPTGEEVPYTIKIRNRGSKAAKGVNLVMHFSDGIEPQSAKGLEHQIGPGKVIFSPITRIDPGQEMTFEVLAEANKSGTHIFRAQLTCEESDSHEVAEGTTRYFGDAIDPSTMSNESRSANTQDQVDGNSFR